jgi:hypothetical protein
MTLPLGLRAVYIIATLAFLTGCGAYAPSTRAPVGIFANEAQVDPQTGSWMLPEAKSEDLIYVTNGQTVQVFAYPSGKPEGQLNGFESASGACVDGKGNVFITDFKPVAIFEYAHGGTKRIATYRLKNVGPFGCAVSPTTGDLAATGSSSNVDIFKPGSHKPSIINDPKMFFNYFCAYDNAGNLYVDGTQSARGAPLVSKLLAGSTTFSTLQLDAPIDTTTNIEWDGKHLVALSYGPPPIKTVHPRIFQFSISGSTGSKVGTVPLSRPADDVVNYTLSNKTLFLSNWQRKKGQYVRTLLLVSYPVGGKPTVQITDGLTAPRGVALSLAQTDSN